MSATPIEKVSQNLAFCEEVVSGSAIDQPLMYWKLQSPLKSLVFLFTTS